MPDPIPTALIVAHGQPSAPQPPEAALAELADRVGAHLPGWTLRAATLASPGRVEALAADLPPGAVIYPLFMARGYFVTRALPARLGDRPLRMADPLGLDPALPALAAEVVRDALAEAGWPARGSRLLLAAHGSARGTAAAEAAEAFAAALRPLLEGVTVRTGYVEQDPRVAEAAEGMGGRAICLPFFAQEGDHCREDIPEALDAAGFAGLRLPPLGLAPGIAPLIARSLQRFSG